MRFWRLVGGFAAAAVLLGGCGSGVPSGSGFGGAQQIAMANPLGLVPVKHPNRRASWIRPDAGKQWLLYVSDGSTGTIDIYNYRARAGKLYGQITGLSFPYGQCTDRAGNVYVVDNNTSKIYEYAHGGTRAIATANDDYGFPIGCSVDPTTGNVAVSNFDGPGSGAGGMVVFSGGLNGSQTNYTDGNLERFFPPGYDPHGNLFVQATAYSGTHEFAELSAGKKKFTLLNGLTVGFPGSVAWDGSYLAVTDQNYQYAYTTMMYRITVSGTNVTIVRATQLTDDCYPHANWMVAVQPFVSGTTGKQNAVVAGNLNCPNRFGFWNYTNGGLPKRTLPTSIAPASPYGQSVSPPSG
jgi:hypothetical protein